MKFLRSILEEFGVKNLPISSFLNWSDMQFDETRKTKASKYKKYGGKEIAEQRKSLKKKIKVDIDKLKKSEDPGIYFVPKDSQKMQFFTLDFYNVRYKKNVVDIFHKWGIDTLEAKTHFSLEDRLNRVHFLRGVNPQLRGTGFAELLYREFIHYIGWATSNADAKGGVKIIWSNLAKSDDFYTVVTYFDVLAISKKKGYTQEEIRQIVFRFIEAKVEDIYKYKGRTEVDPELMEMFPELKSDIYRKGEVVKRYQKMIKKELDHLPFINDSLIINSKGKEEISLIRDVYFQDGRIYYWCVTREGHLIISPYIESGVIGFSKVIWSEVDGIDKYTLLEQDVDVTGIVPDTADIRMTRRNVTVQDLINGVRLAYIPRRTVYNGQELYKLVISRTRVKNALEVRISQDDPRKLQLIKNHEYYKRIFIAR